MSKNLFENALKILDHIFWQRFKLYNVLSSYLLTVNVLIFCWENLISIGTQPNPITFCWHQQDLESKTYLITRRFTTCFKTFGTGSLFEGVRSGAKTLWCRAAQTVTLLVMPVYGVNVLCFFNQTEAVSTC